MTKTKGMRDISTLSGLAHSRVTGTRQQTASELAYLEHEKDRLKRELDLWSANQRRAEGRLQSVEQRMAQLQMAMEEAAPAAKRRAALSNDEADGRDAAARWREVTLEY